MLFIFFLFFLFRNYFSQRPDYESCKMDSTTWNANEMRKIVPNINTFEDCTKTCHDAYFDCDYFTWNNGSHPYFQNTSMLFHEPVQKLECENCM
jgi:hypothetical protein